MVNISGGYNIEWWEHAGAYRAQSFKHPEVLSDHHDRETCLQKLEARVATKDRLAWITEFGADREVQKFRIEDIEITSGPQYVYLQLNQCNLEQEPRAKVVGLFKEIDAKVERRHAGDFDWYWSWIMLIQFLDPEGLLKWPDPDWAVIE